MEMMQKLMKKNNKGFSLVELIVVILIIGILAVAIAPQVMKWVGKAGESQASNEVATLQSAAQTAYAEFKSVATNTQVTFSASVDEKCQVTGTETEYNKLLQEILKGNKLAKSRTVNISDGAISITPDK